MSQKYGTILVIDAYEGSYGQIGNFCPLLYTLDTPISGKGHDGSLATLVRLSGLCDPLLFHHLDTPPPPTYDHGKDRIDYSFVSSDILDSVVWSGIFPYNTLFLNDHTAAYIDINATILFQENTPAIEPPSCRGLQLFDPRITSKYRSKLQTQIDYHKLSDKVHALQEAAEQNKWDQSLIAQYEAVDGIAMHKAEDVTTAKISEKDNESNDEVSEKGK